jgi:hypothetical protein
LQALLFDLVIVFARKMGSLGTMPRCSGGRLMFSDGRPHPRESGQEAFRFRHDPTDGQLLPIKIDAGKQVRQIVVDLGDFRSVIAASGASEKLQNDRHP